VAAPDRDDGPVWINQDAWFSLGDFDAGQSGSYQVRKDGNGIYLFVIDGEIEVAGETLAKRDAVGLTDVGEVAIKAAADSRLLVMDVPMQ